MSLQRRAGQPIAFPAKSQKADAASDLAEMPLAIMAFLNAASFRSCEH